MQPSQLPTGTVTFVLADVEGSVRLWESRRADMAVATARLDELVSQLVEAHGGARPVEQGEGDSFVAAFPIPPDAVAFALAVQRAVGQAEWATVLPLRLRASVHTGVAELRGGDNYMGPTINRSARIRALAHGGQVLLSGAVAGLVTDDLPGDVSLVDQGVHPLRDFDRPEHVFQLAHPDLPERFPPLRAQGNAGRLPNALTTFVARTEELAAVRHLLDGARLVTLTGAGGSGKTRLALEAARSLAGRFADGVAWADAAPISDGALVASCVAGAVEVREVPGEPLLDTLARELRHREALVVVDNCEHVLDEVAAVLERLLRNCPGVRVLATSREPIGVSGESAMRVPSLAEEAAIELFVERAAAARPGFSLSPSAEPAVRDVCRRLDGIPLAIELAASRVRMLSPQQIADGLADRFRLLTGGARTALPRQRTLEASVDWSYRLLSPAERELLARLSVLAGGFDLPAATALCGEEGAAGQVLDVLSALVDKSLVQADEGDAGDGDGDGDVRYLMLETIRHFARQRLADSADAATVRDRHLAYFLQLAEDIGPRVEHGDETTLLDRLDLDLDNLRAALDWAEQSGDVERFGRLAAATWLYWEVRCRFEEGCAALRRAVALSQEPTLTRAMALYGLGDMSLFVPDIAQLVASGEEVAAIGRALGDAVMEARGTTLLGWAASYGAYEEPAWAVGALGEVLGRLSIDDEPWLYLDASIARGYAAATAGDVVGAGAMFDDAILSAGRLSSTGSLQRALFFRGWCHTLANEAADAVPLLDRAVELADDIDDTFIRALSTGVLSFAVFLQGDLPGATRVAAEARSFGERYRNPYPMVMADTVDALAALCSGSRAEARAAVERAGPVADEIGLGWLRAWTEGLAGLLDLDRARLAAAASSIGSGPYARGVLGLFRAWMERASGDAGAAEAAASAALADLAESGVRGCAASALDELGIGAVRREQHERAVRLFAAADAERSRLGMARLDFGTVPSRDADLDAARAALGNSVFDDEWDAGAALSLDAAVRFALRGKGGRRRPTSGWESLTPTELDVVRLVSEGLSNPAIAEKLFISRGTVKVHLSHAFTKLGITSRAELAAAAARRE